MIYSLEERKIGSYFGEDLYEKCIEIPAINARTDHEISLSNDVNKIINVNGFVILDDDVDTKYLINTTSNQIDNNSNHTIYLMLYDKTANDNSIIYVNNFLGADEKIKNGILKIQYTKTI